MFQFKYEMFANEWKEIYFSYKNRARNGDQMLNT